jgi:L-methionine (R)-S-oxide reductase
LQKFEVLEKMNEEQRLKYMLVMLEGQLSSESDIIANLSNASAIIKVVIKDLNWAGFYFLRKDELVLGPFQGLPACNRIKPGTGVCGTAFNEKKIKRIHNVHDFPGHIACDAASNSELVIPIIKSGITYGVLDLDSPIIGKFTEQEEQYLADFVEKLNQYINWEELYT